MKKLTLIALSLFFLGQGSVMAADLLRVHHCKKSSECDAGYKCKKGLHGKNKSWCLKSCKAHTDCPSHSYCSPNGEVCRRICVQNSDCPKTHECRDKKCVRSKK